MRLQSFSSRSKGRGVSNAPTFFISGIRDDGPVYFETLMAEGAQAGQFRDDFADYAALLQRLGESAHQSCAVLTSREKPAVLGPLEGRTAPVRSLLLQGVDVAAGQAILADRDVYGSREDWGTLVQLYSGNPLALKLVSEPIREIFQGDIAAFLASGGAFFNS